MKVDRPAATTPSDDAARPLLKTARDRLVLGAWAALFVNGLAFIALPLLLPIPETLGRVVTQGALSIALVLAAAANPRLTVRPTLVLSLLLLLALVSLMVSVHNEFFPGSLYRALRILGFLAVLWLLSPWWGRPERLLLHCHLRVLWLALASVLVGAAVMPGGAFSIEGRLSGTLWPIPPPQVAHYAAVAGGLTAVLWMCRLVGTRKALALVLLALLVLVATHTRTALAAVSVATVVATVSLFLGHARVRRTAAVVAVSLLVFSLVFAQQLSTWLLRGQSADEAAQLTGRTKVWDAVAASHRSTSEQLFGSGLSDQSFNGLPIDSTWFAAYVDQGWFGIVIYAAVVLVILVRALMTQRGADRAVALFLVCYVLAASVTESTLVSPTPYLLELVLAASLVSVPAKRR